MTPGSLHTSRSSARTFQPAIDLALASAVPPLPWGLSYDTPLEQKSAWQLAIEMLPLRDPETEYYRPQDISRVLPISASQVRRHCSDLWGDGERKEWRLKFSQICALIKRIFFTGRSGLPVEELRRRHQEHMSARSHEATLAQQWAAQKGQKAPSLAFQG